MSANSLNSVQQIISLLFAKKHQAQDYIQCQGASCLHCQEPHFNKLLKAVSNQQVITLVLPAFPAKSANRQKTISCKPDLGEVMGLENLNYLCESIQQIYSAGVELIICSDGRVFNDLVLVSDEEVNLYQQGIKTIITQKNLRNLKIFSLDDVYPQQNYQNMRDQLMQSYGESLISLKQRLLADEKALYQFNGIHRFILEDQLALNKQFSKNRIRTMAKEIAYEVIRRSNAWSNLLAQYFSGAVRLSIHPQPCASDKLGIQFLPATNRWATPWHNVLLKHGDSWQLVKRIDAERLGAKLNHDHYVLEAI
ncbi:isocyanide synthase family protein [Legionella brunensis]|uniref:Pyoverdine biosynthesis protein PvcA n=1 Tax=Legionella brunensis TaxID=29422 RepID=A0A0W0S3Z5_9GAMM|nr:isocyanide synthase family protein [Legionella brunensis]KTC78190.1 pyoverdine biosynthesis protein PvcA [Legionella brunensis]